jgi:hypothetical protein
VAVAAAVDMAAVAAAAAAVDMAAVAAVAAAVAGMAAVAAVAAAVADMAAVAAPATDKWHGGAVVYGAGFKTPSDAKWPRFTAA